MTGFIGGTGSSPITPALTRTMIAAACVALVAACDEPAITEAPVSVRSAIPSSVSTARSGATPVVKFG